MKLHALFYAFAVTVVIVGTYFYMQQPASAPANTAPAQTPDQTINKSITQTTMKLTSPAFENNQSIPVKYTCDGEDLSPPLKIAEVPAEAKSLVLIVDDPDAPVGDWVHWTVLNIPPQTAEIAEGKAPEGLEGKTDFGTPGYGGPCPPGGTHRYFFKLYALDTKLNLPASAKKADIEKAMEDHIITRTELVGLYKRG